MPLFQETTFNPDKFFSILPSDWQEGIVPYWRNYHNSAKIYILEDRALVLGGGIVFSTVSPDTLTYKEEAQHWFDQGYLYIAFLWISEEQRGKQLGRFWLQNLIKMFPAQKFWLSIEEFPLCKFYLKNGFQLIKKIETPAGEEWILCYEPPQ